MVHLLLAEMYRGAKVQDKADADAAAADANAAAMQDLVTAQSARASVQQAVSDGAPAAKTFQVEPLRVHVTLPDDAGPGATTGQASLRRTVSAPGEQGPPKAAPEPPMRVLPVKSNLAASSIKGSKPQWMLRAAEKGESRLTHPASCTTASLHARCGQCPQSYAQRCSCAQQIWPCM